MTRRTPLSVSIAALAALTALTALTVVAPACSSHYYADPGGRFHVEMPMSMNVGTTSKGNVRMEPGNDTAITIVATDTDAADLDAYVAAKLDAETLAHGDSTELTIAGLDALRLEFRGGIDLGGGIPVAPNLVTYLIFDGDGGSVYALSCSGEDGPFENFCVGAFDDMAMTFNVGSPGT